MAIASLYSKVFGLSVISSSLVKSAVVNTLNVARAVAAEVIADSIRVSIFKGTAAISTAAAGSTTSDAGVLPAKRLVCPTTAADDTKGVRLHADSLVTGAFVFVGNGVSNKVLKVYPPTGGTINGASANAAFSSASGKGVILYCASATDNAWLAW